MIEKFITYKEDLTSFDQRIQDQILFGCLRSWEKKKFKTRVLSRNDAESHLLYKDLLFASKKHCKVKKNTPLHILKKRQFHSEASIIRWLAFANSKENNFFFGDYDIFNIGVNIGDLDYKKLTFLNGQCLCFSFAEKWQLAEHLVEIFIKNIDIMSSWNEPYVFYHDQDLVFNFLKSKPEIFIKNNFIFEDIVVKQPIDGIIPENCRLLHISHFAHKNLDNIFGCRELARLNTVRNALNLLEKNEKKLK